MLKLLRQYWPAILLSLALLLVLDGTISSLLTCHPPPNGASQSQNSQEHCTVFQGPLSSLIVFIGEFFEAHDKGIVAAFTVILAISTILLWDATKNLWTEAQAQRSENKLAADRQFETTQQSIDLARQEFLSTHRPKIRIKAVFLMNERIHHTQPIVVRVVCVNNGVGDATIASYGIECFLVKKGTPAPPDKKLPLITFAQTSILESGMSTALPDFHHVITNADEAGIRYEESNLYCMGFIHYWDGAGRTRMTAFCRVMKLDNPRALHARGRFDRADEPDYEYAD
jgi:hypothetical protein